MPPSAVRVPSPTGAHLLPSLPSLAALMWAHPPGPAVDFGLGTEAEIAASGHSAITAATAALPAVADVAACAASAAACPQLVHCNITLPQSSEDQPEKAGALALACPQGTFWLPLLRPSVLSTSGVSQ
jgi:hypothetical protein